MTSESYDAAKRLKLRHVLLVVRNNGFSHHCMREETVHHAQRENPSGWSRRGF